MTASSAVIHQSLLFAQAFVWGICFSAAYDCLRIIRRGIPHPRWLSAAADILFWIALAGAVYGLLYRHDDGALRSYTTVGMAVGMLLYTLLLSRRIVEIFGGIFRKIVNYLRKLLKKMRRTFKIENNERRRKGK